MKIKSLLLFLAYFVSVQSALCGCQACWKLYRADLELKNGEGFDVYLLWNDEWLETDFRQAKIKSFPGILLEGIESGIKLIAYNYFDLRELKYPKEELLVSVNEPLTIAFDNIKGVKLKEGIFNGHGGAGAIPVLSYKAVELLRNRPYAQYHYDDILSDVYWLSYNNNITETDLAVLNKPALRFLVKYTGEFLEHKIIRLEFAYD